jgi:hypothetical protein
MEPRTWKEVPEGGQYDGHSSRRSRVAHVHAIGGSDRAGDRSSYSAPGAETFQRAGAENVNGEGAALLTWETSADKYSIACPYD